VFLATAVSGKIYFFKGCLLLDFSQDDDLLNNYLISSRQRIGGVELESESTEKKFV